MERSCKTGQQDFGSEEYLMIANGEIESSNETKYAIAERIRIPALNKGFINRNKNVWFKIRDRSAYV